MIVIAIFSTIIGFIFIFLSKQLVRVEAKLRNKKSKAIDENLVKTQFYIAGGMFLFLGLFLFGWEIGFFSI